MATEYKELEKKILLLLSDGKEFFFNGITYKVIKSGKPKGTGRGGEPKTDIYVKAEDIKNVGKSTEFKISVKKNNADFLENKIQAQRASIIWGQDWSSIIRQNIIKCIEVDIRKKYLIYKKTLNRTRPGSICLGWRLDIMNKSSGELSKKLELSPEQKREILTGENLPDTKKNSLVNDQEVRNSGVANYIMDDIDIAHLSEKNIGNFLKHIDDFNFNNYEMFFALKALNYRSFKSKEKWDGDRPLAIAIEWSVESNKLKPEIIFDRPLLIKGNVMGKRLESALKSINVENTDKLNQENVDDYSKICLS